MLPPTHPTPAPACQGPTCITVQGAVRGWVTHEGHHCLAHTQQGPSWTPGSLQDVQADLPCLQHSHKIMVTLARSFMKDMRV
jgi:hypothetical protein